MRPNMPQSTTPKTPVIGLQNLYSAVRFRPAPPPPATTETPVITADSAQFGEIACGPKTPRVSDSESAKDGRSRPSRSDMDSDNGSDKDLSGGNALDPKTNGDVLSCIEDPDLRGFVAELLTAQSAVSGAFGDADGYTGEWFEAE